MVTKGGATVRTEIADTKDGDSRVVYWYFETEKDLADNSCAVIKN